MRTLRFGVEIQSPLAIIQSEPSTLKDSVLDVDNLVPKFSFFIRNSWPRILLVINCIQL